MSGILKAATLTVSSMPFATTLVLESTLAISSANLASDLAMFSIASLASDAARPGSASPASCTLGRGPAEVLTDEVVLTFFMPFLKFFFIWPLSGSPSLPFLTAPRPAPARNFFGPLPASLPSLGAFFVLPLPPFLMVFLPVGFLSFFLSSAWLSAGRMALNSGRASWAVLAS